MSGAISAVLIVVGLLIAGLLTWIGLTLSRRKVTVTADAHEALRLQAEAEAAVVRSRAEAQESRATGSSPTLNVIQLPSPTRGSLSPVEGIGRVRIGDRPGAAVKGRSTEAAPAARDASKVRRLNVGGRDIRMLFFSGSPGLAQHAVKSVDSRCPHRASTRTLPAEKFSPASRDESLGITD